VAGWLEVSLSVDAEAAEAVADLFSRHAPHGVVLETERIDPDLPEARPSPTTRVRAYLPQADDLADRLRALETGLWHLGQIRPLPDPEYREVADEDWSLAWKSNYRPLTVGRRLQVVPAWLEAPPGDRLTLWMDPGMAFGTGSHPTTRLCLEAVEALLRPGQIVADLGCGSGILGFAAAALGARRVYACDIDPQAVVAARAGAARNDVGDSMEIFEGSLEALAARVEAAGTRADLLLANLLEGILLDLLPRGLAALVRPGGRLVLSGILADQAQRVAEAAEGEGLQPLETLADGDWRALIFETRPPPQAGAAGDADR
jgi:ribosomal protein L11 methyltransferase